MPAGNPTAYNDPIVQQLIERGLLATGGNIRAIPFGSNQGVASNAVGSGLSASSGAGGVTRNADGTYNVVDENGNEQVVDVTPVAQELGEDTSSDLSWLAAAIAGGSGALIGQALARRRKGVDPLAPLDDPKQLGGTVGVERDTSPRGSSIVPVADDIIDGEFRVVEPESIATRNQKALSAPQAKVSGATTKQLAERKVKEGATQASEISRIALPDEFSDLSPEELAKARNITQELIKRRQKGNVSAYSPTRERTLSGKPRGRGGLPTSPNFATETEADLLGHVVRALRDAKTVRSLSRVAR